MTYVLFLLGGMAIGSLVLGIVLCFAFYIGSFILIVLGGAWAIFKFILSPLFSLLRYLCRKRRRA